MQLNKCTIGLHHPHNFNRNIIVEYLKIALENTIVKIDSWEEVATCDCSIIVLIEPEILINQITERVLKKTIYSINKKVIVIPFHEQKRIKTTEDIVVLNHNVNMTQFISKIKEIETLIF